MQYSQNFSGVAAKAHKQQKSRTPRSKSSLVNSPGAGVGRDCRRRDNGYGSCQVGLGGRRAVLAVALRRLEVEVGDHHRPRLRRRLCLRHRLRPVDRRRLRPPPERVLDWPLTTTCKVAGRAATSNESDRPDQHQKISCLMGHSVLGPCQFSKKARRDHGSNV
jgi:hypothetical protein